MTEASTYHRLLVLVEDTPLGHATAERGVQLAKVLGAEVLFLAAVPPAPPMMGEVDVAMFEPVADHEAAGRDQAKRAFKMAQALASAAGVPSRTQVSMGVDPAEAANQAANEQDCAMIVVGSHGRGTLARLVLGSVMTHLTQIADRPVLVCKLHESPLPAAKVPSAPPAATAE